MKFSEVSDVYQVGSQAIATREILHHSGTGRLASYINTISRSSLEYTEDELWMAIIRRCRRTLRELGSTPLPFNDPSFDLAGTSQYLSQLTIQARGSYPETLLHALDQAIQSLLALSQSSDNPVGSLVLEILHTGTEERSAVLVRLSPQLASIEKWVTSKTSGTAVLTARQLPSVSALETLVVIGPSFWFPTHVLTAPRAESICFVHYGWLRDREQDSRLFAGSQHAPGVQIRTPYAPELPSDQVISADELTPAVNWGALEKLSEDGRLPFRGDSYRADAHLFLLSGGYCVYLEIVDGASILVIDLEAEGIHRLHTEHAASIQVGSYIVLRSEGASGDFIPEVADSLLGARSRHLRQLQREWKGALWNKIREYGYSGVERQLRALGVTYPNVRYRVWRNSISTQEPKDFLLLMQYIGLGERAEELWSAMAEIREAHIRAGQKVRRLLDQAVLGSDLDALVVQGFIEVRLPEIDAGALTVFRVEARSPKPSQVSEDLLRVVRKIEDDLWQG
jgi:hypothetical protein